MVYLIIVGCTLPNLGLDPLQKTIMCKLTQEVTYYGWIVLAARAVQRKVVLVYVLLTFHLNLISLFLNWNHYHGTLLYHVSQIMFWPSIEETLLLQLFLLQLDLTLYDPKSSSTSSLVACDQAFCTSTYNGQLTGCRPEVLCQYEVVYGDGSSTSGYFVNDNVQFDRVTGNLQTAPGNGSIIFGWVVFLTCFGNLKVMHW